MDRLINIDRNHLNSFVMFRPITALLFLVLCGTSYAQDYYYFMTEGSDPGFVYNDPAADTIMLEDADEQMTVPQALPFAWDFYGTPVTHYLVSDNGYLTFDTTATTSEPMNDTPPTAGSVNNAIYACWDDLMLQNATGAMDRILNWTYGSAPNRTHVV